MTPPISHVEAQSDYKLRVEFENGEGRLFDVTPYLDKGVFRELRDEAYFRRVRPVWGGVGWPQEQDLSADTLYCAGKPLATPAAGSGRDDRSQAPAPMAAQSDRS